MHFCWLPGFTGPSPSTTLDKLYLLSIHIIPIYYKFVNTVGYIPGQTHAPLYCLFLKDGHFLQVGIGLSPFFFMASPGLIVSASFSILKPQYVSPLAITIHQSPLLFEEITAGFLLFSKILYTVCCCNFILQQLFSFLI